MPKAPLTDNLLRSKNTTGEFWDTGVPGLCVRKGNRLTTFFAARRMPGARQPTWRKLGVYPEMGLADARRRAREVLAALSAGDDPAAADVPTAAGSPVLDVGPTFATVAEEFIKTYLPRLRSARACEALIRRELLPVLGTKPVGDIRRRDIIALVEAVRARGDGPERSGGEYAARHVLAQLSKLFNWALARDYEGLDANPCAIRVGELLGRARARTRVLDDGEVRRVWWAAAAMGQPFGSLFQLLLLTGQRLNEIAGASWNEVDMERAVMVVPALRMKGKEDHSVPLTPAVVDILRSLPRFMGGDFILTTTAGRRPVSGFSKAKAELDVLSGVKGFTIHDLRRTARTGLSVTGATPFIAELVIAHRQAGVHAVYDLHTYDTEKRQALLAWEARLQEIAGEPPEVVALRRPG